MSSIARRILNKYQKKWEIKRHAQKHFDINKLKKEANKYKFTLQIERDNLVSKCLEDEKYGKALFNNKTKSFLNSLKQTVLEKSNIVGVIHGYTNSGKSRMAQSILYLIRNYMKELRGLEYPIFVVYDREDMQQILREEKPPYGLVLDEFPSESGKDSQLKLEAIKNISDSIRIEQISIIICTPIKATRGFVNFKLYMAGTNPEENMLRALLFLGDTVYPVGCIEIPYHRDEPFFEKYMGKKLDYTKKIRESGGFVVSNFDKERAEKHIQYFYKLLTKQYGTAIKSTSDIVSLMELAGMDGKPYNETENFKKRVASGVKALILNDYYKGKEKKKKNNEDTDKDIMDKKKGDIYFEVSREPELTFPDQNFKEMILNELRKDVEPNEFEVYKFICEGESYRNILSKESRPVKNPLEINRIKNKIQNKYLGYAGERAYCNLLRQQGKEFEYGGENTPEADFINHTDKEILSFKTYTYYNESKAKHRIAKDELLTAMNLQYSCFLLIYTMSTGEFRKFRVYFSRLGEPVQNLSKNDPPS